MKMKPNLRRALSKRSPSELVELHDAWVGGDPPAERTTLVRQLRRRMKEPTAAAAVRRRLSEAAARILDPLLVAGEEGVEFSGLRRELAADGLKTGALRSGLTELLSYGLAIASASGGARSNGDTLWWVPIEVADALQSAAEDGLSPAGLLTLHGHLEHRFRRDHDDDAAAEQARKMYRFLAAESALCARVGDLPEAARTIVERAITDWGGLVPVEELDTLGAKPTSAAKLRELLEEASLGTIGTLDLERHGIRQRGQVLAVFNEAVLASLRSSAREHPVEPRDTASIGVDFVSNFSRFAAFVGDENVRFTVRGTIFKSTGKRIADSLIPNPGREFRRREILELEYRFALRYRFIDRTGERSFRLTPEGLDFLALPLIEKQRLMLDWLVEDQELPGDMAHQLRLRRIALRYLKRLEPGTWYDAMFLPFVVRNHYIATLGTECEDPGDGASFPVRSSADLQSLAWNLFTWARKHLYLLGVIDMGYDRSGRACAIRLTQMGAELLGMIPSRELEGAGHLVVNPDFEVVLFPDEHSHTLVYQLDRFCERELTDSLYHYRISPGSLHRALQEGVRLDEILKLLRERSRTPLPQNVAYSLESWARSDGLVTWHEDGRLVCETPEILDRLQLHPELGRLGLERLDRETLVVQKQVASDQLAGWFRDYGVSLRIAS